MWSIRIEHHKTGAVVLPPVEETVGAVSAGAVCPGCAPALILHRYRALSLGAGEGIRTLDPDLGKVVLYP